MSGILVNNAGITGELVGPEDTLPTHLIPVFRVNVLGPVRVTHAFLPLLRAAPDPRVVMVSSGNGSLAIVTDPARLESTIAHLMYPTSKAALNMLTTQYAKGIPDVRFNLTDPGYTATDLNNNQGTQTVTEGTDAIVGTRHRLARTDRAVPRPRRRRPLVTGPFPSSAKFRHRHGSRGG